MKKIFLSILSMIVVFLGVNSVSSDYIHTCGITVNEELKCWGDSSNGKINVPIGFKWKSFSIGGQHTCGITTTDELKCWGWNTNGQTNVPTGFKWKSVKLGTYNTCGITTTDELKCWGNNTNNKNNVPIGFKWKSYQLGYSNTCGITINDELKCWGDNINGQLNIPIGFKWNQVGIGNRYICGITLDSELKCWGYKGNWQKQPPEGYKWRKIYSNQPFTCGITTTNELKCWGFSAYGQLDSPNGYIWKKISNFGTHTCGITNNDELKCWGENFSGQTEPPTGFLWKDIYNGLYYSCGITTNDELKCWGDNYERQLNNIPVGYNWLKFIENEEIENNLDFIQIPTPTNLNQYIIQATLEDREEVQVGSKIGKFQSGSGVIFEAEIDNPEGKELRLNIELYKKGEITTKQNYTSDYFINSGKVFTKILLNEGDYYWNIKIEDRDGNASEIVDFKDNGTDTDFFIFEGFEPYPYGFSFVNGSPTSGMLTGGISGFEVGNYDLRFKISGRKWNIFYKAFDTSEIENDKRKLFDMFESLGLNNDITLFDNGSCFGLSTLSLLKYQDDYFKSKNIPNYLEQNHNRLYTKIKNGNIYDLISNPSSTLNQNWDTYSDDLEDIFAFHLSGNSKNNIDLNNDGVPKNFIGKLIYNPNKILETLKNNPDKKYILNFEWKKSDGNLTGHSVIPYRVNGNRIYIYDNVVKFPFIYTEKYGILKSYEQYIEIQDNGKIIIKSWPDINEKDLTLMGLMDIEEMNNNGKKSIPKGFNDIDTLYILRGNSDLLITDINGNKTGYKNGEIYDEIQGTRIVVNYAGDTTDYTWKQIYLPQKLENLTIEINGKVDENYDLMIAGGDYYTKLEGITTSSGQTDTFNISRENIKIDFDDNKTGSYNILVDDFQNNSTGSIYLHQLETIKEKQELSIDWNKVVNNENDSINYSIDLDNDGIYDIESNFNSLPKIENETGSISGKVISSPSNAGYKVCIDSNNNSKCEENIEGFIVTDNTGNYKFDNLNKGSYNIIQEPRNNWEIIKPLDKKYTIKLNNGQNIVNLNFENSKINGNKNNKK